MLGKMFLGCAETEDMFVCACREMERREKVEEARRETERILAEQEAEVARRKVRNTAQHTQHDHSTCIRTCSRLIHCGQHGQ